MPALGANTLCRKNESRVTKPFITASLGIGRKYTSRIHSGHPCIQSSVLLAIFRRIIIARTHQSIKIEILSHPYLITNLNGLVNLAISFIQKLAILASL